MDIFLACYKNVGIFQSSRELFGGHCPAEDLFCWICPAERIFLLICWAESYFVEEFSQIGAVLILIAFAKH